jgi:hypothetical protein
VPQTIKGEGTRSLPPAYFPAPSSTARIKIFSHQLNRILALASNDRILPRAAGFVRDSQPFSDARFSSQEVKRFFGIVGDWMMASQMV